MSQEFPITFTPEIKTAFYEKWQAIIRQPGYTFEVARFDQTVKQRHQALWQQLVLALSGNCFDNYLCLVEEEGRCQARAGSRLEAVVSQFSAIMGLLWEVLSESAAVTANPTLLRPLTEKLNALRSRSEAAMLHSFVEEQTRIQEEQAQESVQMRRLRLERTELADLIKSIPAFRLNRYQEGRLIFQPGDSRAIIYFVLVGRVKVYEILPDARLITLSLLSVGDVFVQSQKQQNYFHDVYAEAMRPAIVAAIDERSLEGLMETAPLLASQIIYSFSEQLSQSQTLIEGLLGRDVAVRLANVLLKLATEFGVADSGGGITIEQSLTHQRLADMLGSNRVTVTRKMLELQKKKLIKVEQGTISILNLKALKALVA